MSDKSLAVIIVAGGTGSRMKSDVPKQFLKINNKEIIEHTLIAFEKSDIADCVVVVCRGEYISHMEKIASRFSDSMAIRIVPGGETRQDSVYKGIEAVKDYKYVMIHDAVRCCIKPEEIRSLYSVLTHTDGCAFGVLVKDTIKQTDSDCNILATLDRSNLWQIQTPQAFITQDIIKAHEYASINNIKATDDCALAELIGLNIKIVEGSYDNIKITTQEDVYLAEMILKRQ